MKQILTSWFLLFLYGFIGSQTIAPDCPGEIIFFKSKLNYENDTVSIDVRNEISNLESLLPLEIVFLDSLLSILGSYTINTNHSSIRFPFCEIVGNLRYVKYKNALGECTSTIVGSNEFSDHILLFGSNQTVFCSDPDSLVQHSSSDEHIPIECSHIDVRWQIYGISRGADCDNDSIAGISIHDNRYRIGPNGFYHSDTITILKIPPRQDTLICWGSSLGVQEQIITAEGIYYDTLPNCSCILSYNVTIKDYQSLEVDLSDQFVCPGGEIRVTANDGFANYFWSTGEKTPTIFINEPGAYSLLVESFNDCQMFYDFEIDYLDLYLQQDLCYIGFDTLFGDYSIFFDPLRKIGTVVYVISDIGSGTAVPLDTISVYDEPVFHLANNGPMTLQLATIDACGDYHASVNPSATHQPVFLNAEVEDSNKINLQWNPYSGREVDHYEIFLLQENGPDIFVDSVDSGMNNFNDLNAPRGLLKYYIKIVFSEAISCHQEDDTKPSVISNVVSLLNIRPVISQVNYPIQVFPNPTRGEITLGGTTLADVRVFDVTGGEILFFESVRRVDLQNLNSGIYYLRITTNDRIYTERIAKI